MARVIKFCSPQVYQGNAAAVGDFFTEAQEVVDVSRLDAELRVMALSGSSPSITGSIQTTSDPTFDNLAWQSVGALTGTTTGTFTGVFSGLGRYARARLTVTAGGYVTACLQAVGREA